mmetsp:Transcript_25501/g.66577  ORF Transcript_25501/g.66577 Transcript_25501/m.66577 type:complete len:374 (-) Transcript_25501:102-1223(-)
MRRSPRTAGSSSCSGSSACSAPAPRRPSSSCSSSWWRRAWRWSTERRSSASARGSRPRSPPSSCCRSAARSTGSSSATRAPASTSTSPGPAPSSSASTSASWGPPGCRRGTRTPRSPRGRSAPSTASPRWPTGSTSPRCPPCACWRASCPRGCARSTSRGWSSRRAWQLRPSSCSASGPPASTRWSGPAPPRARRRSTSRRAPTRRRAERWTTPSGSTWTSGARPSCDRSGGVGREPPPGEAGRRGRLGGPPVRGLLGSERARGACPCRPKCEGCCLPLGRGPRVRPATPWQAKAHSACPPNSSPMSSTRSQGLLLPLNGSRSSLPTRPLLQRRLLEPGLLVRPAALAPRRCEPLLRRSDILICSLGHMCHAV